MPRPWSRPARPITWLRSCQVRSAARGSPLPRPKSASTTPTRLSRGKWCPFATNCGPMMMSTRPSAISFNSLRMVSIEVMRSLDSTMVRASGNSAAAIEEQQRLLAPFHREPDLFGEPRRNEAAAWRRLASEIDRLDMRHVLAAESRGQHYALVAGLSRIDLGLDRGRRGGQHDRDLRDMGAHDRHVAGMVVHAVVLLVGLVMLFIDHDQPEIGVREERRRTRADHHRRFAGRDRGPVAGTGARGQFGMPLQ